MKAKLNAIFLLLFAFFIFSNVYADNNEHSSSGLQVGKTAVSLSVGQTASVAVTNASGTVSLAIGNTHIVSATYSKGVLSLKGLQAGKTSVIVKDRYASKTITVAVVGLGLTVSPTTLSLAVGATGKISVSNASGSVSATSSNTAIATASYASGVVTVKGVKVGTASVQIKDNSVTQTVTVTVTGSGTVSLQVSPTASSLKVGATASLNVTNASGTVSVQSGDASIVTASYANGVITLKGIKVGSTIVTLKDSKTSINIPVSVTSATVSSLSAFPLTVALTVGGQSVITVTNATGNVTVTPGNASIATVSTTTTTATGGTYTVVGKAAGTTTIAIKDGSGTTVNVTANVMSGTSSSNYTLLAWNDLGMHCMDGLDFSVFTILPPYNTLHAQLKDKAGQLITSGVILTYEAIADSSGSINTYSAGKAGLADKTNFWDEITIMLGLPANALPKDTGINLDGLTLGTPAPGNKTPSLIPQPLSYNTAFGWYEAEGLPITPFDDAGKKNFYPTVKVVAKDLNGTELASTTTTLPVSDEMTCKACHASTTATDAPRTAAKPVKGWLFDANPDKDWKKNILQLHDDRKLSTTLYQQALATNGYNAAGLLKTSEAGTPVLCVKCHASNAYFDKEAKTTAMPGIAGIRPFTQALHTKHASVISPTSLKKLDDITDKTSCYLCHPGSETNCLRGAMSTAQDTAGNLLSCQNCHGNLSAVGSPNRKGWYNEPTCESCHNSAATGKRGMSAVDANGNNIVPADHTFATNADTPVPGLNLYRFSKGHGGLQCEACHGSTHAEYPSTHVDDNAQSLKVQGHVGPVAECTACHTTIPTTVNGGPHGMHTTGNAWVSAHQHASKSGTATTPNCAYCHGATSAGTPLSAVKVAKTINAGEFGTKNWAAGYQVSCYSCHNGPNP